VPVAPLEALDPARFDRPELHRGVVRAARALAELKGVAASVPNAGVLLGTLSLMEARDSAALENIVATPDALLRVYASPEGSDTPAAKVVRCGVALRRGFEEVQRTGRLTGRDIQSIQWMMEQNHGGFRRVPGTVLKDESGRIIYTTPQEVAEVVQRMEALEKFINAPSPSPMDPLVCLALLHHQFASIHPFHEGNGRTGRIVNVLYLVKEGLLDLPILGLSRHFLDTRARYVALQQAVRDDDRWEAWVAYVLEAVEHTARDTLARVQAIRALLLDTKHRIRARHRFYSQDLLTSLFRHPYTRSLFVEQELGVSRLTATRYLDLLVNDGLLIKQRAGRIVLYRHVGLVDILTGAASGPA
jgi:Fic family protein